MSPSLSGLLGRYECVVPGVHDKFWTCRFNESTGRYDTEWGKRGHAAQGTKEGLTGTEALKKIHEKIAKGYRLVESDNVTELKVADEPENEAEPVDAESFADALDALRKLG